jgi:alcohol dehydrogenase
MIRAAVFDGPGRPFRFARAAAPRLGPGEALVRVSLSTVCGSDLHTVAGRRAQPTPSVLGHEPVGVVEEVNGELFDVAGEPVRVGDRVVWAVAVSCRRCFFCTHGLPQKCEHLRKYGHEPHADGDAPLGGLATHCRLLPGTAVVKVPPDLPDEVAAPAGCATATVMAARRAGRVSDGPRRPVAHASGSSGTVAVVGLGMLGLTACAVAAADGHTVLACDVSDARLSQAARFGAPHLTKPAGLVDAAKALTAGRGADVVLELSGSADAAALSLAAARVGGTVVWVGAVSPVGTVPVDPQAVVRRCLTLVGVHNYAPQDLAAAVHFLGAHHACYPFAGLVADTFPLDRVDAAFRFAEAERPVRVAVRPGAGGGGPDRA